MSDLTTRRQLVGSGISAAALGILLTIGLYPLSLQNSLLGPLFAVLLAFLRAVVLFSIIWPVSVIWTSGKRWGVTLGMGLVALQGIFLLAYSCGDEYRGYRRQQAATESDVLQSRITTELDQGKVGGFKDLIGTKALSLALVQYVESDRITSDRIHEVVTAYMADDYSMARVAEHKLTARDDLRAIFHFYQNPATHKPLQYRQDWAEALNNVARNPHTPPDVLIEILNSPLASVAAANSACPARERKFWLAKAIHGDEQLRLGVASNVYSAPELLLTLRSDPDLRVQAALAGNPSSPAPLLNDLAEASDKDIRVIVAGNPSASPGTLEKLAGDESAWMRTRAVCNPSAPESLLRRVMKEDREDWVRQAAQRCLGERQKGGQT